MLTRSIASWASLQKPPVLKPLQKSAPCFVLCRLVRGGPTFGAFEPKSASGMTARYRLVLSACPSVRLHDPPSFVARVLTATASFLLLTSNSKTINQMTRFHCLLFQGNLR